MGIYLIIHPRGARFVVVANTASEAASKAADHVARTVDIDRSVVDESEYQVGRVGTFDPGIEGARLSAITGDVLVAG